MSGPFTYQGTHVVVTGGSTGVGAALLEVLHELEADKVTVLDVKAPEGPHDRHLTTDLSDPSAVDEAVDAIEGAVDVLFNNAGIAATQSPRTVLAVNYLALRRLSERLLERIPPGGAIVNTASTAGGRWKRHAEAIDDLLEIADWTKALAWLDAHLDEVGGDAYAFSKEAVLAWCARSCRTTMSAGVRTNSVSPGPIDTPLLDDFKVTMAEELLAWTVEQATGAFATAREVAMPLAFLGSPAAAYVNGHDLVVDGGVRAALATGQLSRPDGPA